MTVREVNLPGTDIVSSVLGFGCASLGSRIARKAGLKSLEQAYEAGVTWYDVAPPYGAGEAEPILGEFLEGRRHRVQVCTKVGLTHPERNGVMRLVYAVARPLVGHIKGVRQRFRRMPSTRYQKAVLDAASITASIDRSLSRLKTDHVDVFALHDPAEADVTRDEVLRALETIVSSGKARYLSVGGTLPACRAAVGPNLPFGLVQFADDPRLAALAAIQAAAVRPVATITHSVFGVAGAHERLVARLRSEAGAASRLAAAGYGGTVEAAAAALLLDRALASNASGVVLASMFSARNLGFNLDRASRPPSPASIVLVRDLLGDGDSSRDRQA